MLQFTFLIQDATPTLGTEAFCERVLLEAKICTTKLDKFVHFWVCLTRFLFPKCDCGHKIHLNHFPQIRLWVKLLFLLLIPPLLEASINPLLQDVFYEIKRTKVKHYNSRLGQYHDLDHGWYHKRNWLLDCLIHISLPI